MVKQSMKAPFLAGDDEYDRRKKWRTALWFLISIIAITFILLTLGGNSNSSWLDGGRRFRKRIRAGDAPETTRRVQAEDVVESWGAAVAADDARCSEIGASVLRVGGHAVDAAVAAALCLGVVNPMASGVGGGGFMIVRSAATSQTYALDFRETAPLAASEVLSIDYPPSDT